MNRWKRREPPPIVLTQRDKQILLAVYRGRYLTTHHLEKRFFGCRPRANVRLRKLFDHGLLDRHLPTSTLRNEFSSMLYSIGKGGVPIVASELGIDLTVIRRHRKQDNNFSLLQIEHILAINTFQRTIEDAANQRDIVLETWVSERELQDTYALSEQDKRIRPDGYGRIIHNRRLYSFFLEADLGTETNAILEKKFNAYQKYRDFGGYEQTFGVKKFRVLVVTTSEIRLKNLKHVAEKIGMDSCWLTTFDALKSAHSILGSIWSKSGENQELPFI